MKVLGWDPDGSIELNDVVCTENWATRYGGCFYANGELVVNNGTLMQGNVGFRGGCICEWLLVVYAPTFSAVYAAVRRSSPQ